MKVKGEEYLARINFLAQAAERITEAYPTLGKYYGKVLKTISEKTSAKLDYTLKRSLCKGCQVPLLVPGANVRYRLKRRKGRKGGPTHLLTCKGCGTMKKFLTKPNYKLFAEEGQIVKV